MFGKQNMVRCPQCHRRLGVRKGEYEVTCPQCKQVVSLPKPIAVDSSTSVSDALSTADAAFAAGEYLKAGEYYHYVTGKESANLEAWRKKAASYLKASTFDAFYLQDVLNCFNQLMVKSGDYKELRDFVKNCDLECERMMGDIQAQLSVIPFNHPVLELEEYFGQIINIGNFLEGILIGVDAHRPKNDKDEADVAAWQALQEDASKVLLKYVVQFSSRCKGVDDMQMQILMRDFCTPKYHRAVGTIQSIKPDFICDYQLENKEKKHWVSAVICVVLAIIFAIFFLWFLDE